MDRVEELINKSILNVIPQHLGCELCRYKMVSSSSIENQPRLSAINGKSSTLRVCLIGGPIFVTDHKLVAYVAFCPHFICNGQHKYFLENTVVVFTMVAFYPRDVCLRSWLYSLMNWPGSFGTREGPICFSPLSLGYTPNSQLYTWSPVVLQ